MEQGDRRNLMPPTPGEGVSLIKNCHPGSRRDICTSNEVRLCSWTESTSIDMLLNGCCNSLTQTSEHRVRQFTVTIFTWLSLRATNNEERDVVWHNRYSCFLAHLDSTSETMVHYDRTRYGIMISIKQCRDDCIFCKETQVKMYIAVPIQCDQ